MNAMKPNGTKVIGGMESGPDMVVIVLEMGPNTKAASCLDTTMELELCDLPVDKSLKVNSSGVK
jgi:hypothetical protein